MRLLFVYALTVALAATARTASFDCGKASTAVEKVICAWAA